MILHRYEEILIQSQKTWPQNGLFCGRFFATLKFLSFYFPRINGSILVNWRTWRFAIIRGFEWISLQMILDTHYFFLNSLEVPFETFLLTFLFSVSFSVSSFNKTDQDSENNNFLASLFLIKKISPSSFLNKIKTFCSFYTDYQKRKL